MGKADRFEHGTWNAICDTCGLKLKANQLWKTWDGFRVCEPCWEPRHPQDFVKGKRDMQRVPWSRPDRDQTAWTGTLNGALTAGATTLVMASVGIAAEYMTIGITLDIIVQDASGISGGDLANQTGYRVQWSTIESVSSPNIVINDALEYAASSGNVVYIMYDNTINFLSVGDVTTDDL